MFSTIFNNTVLSVKSNYILKYNMNYNNFNNNNNNNYYRKKSLSHEQRERIFKTEKKKKNNNNNKFNIWSIYNRISIVIIVILSTIILLFTVIIPVVFRFYTSVHYAAVFAHFWDTDLYHYQAYWPKSIHQFVLENEEDLDSAGHPIQLGVWYIPSSEYYNKKDNTWITNDSALTSSNSHNQRNNQLMVLYVHGAGATRGSYPRVSLYKRLSNYLKVQVIAFDYCGFADSSPIRPTIGGLIRDTKVVYKWILSRGVSPQSVLFWGHSLGSAVVIRLLATASKMPIPKCLILEAPMTSLSEAIETSTYTRLFRLLPWFKWCFITPLINNCDLNFDSLNMLHKVRCPLLVLHAKDDDAIPMRQGITLYRTARRKQPLSVRYKARLHQFGIMSDYHLGHHMINRAPDFISTIDNFLQELKDSKD